jgi:anti-sigma B factor antagonist
MAASVESRMEGKGIRITVSGEMTITSASALKPTLLRLLSGPAMALDLSGVSEIDTSGIQLIVLLKREAAGRGFSITTYPSEAVRAAFALYGMAAE